MPAAERRWAWPLAVAALVLAAFGLRLWGFRQGLPFVYNADENAHFVAGAIGMFGHTYNPNYFINPPGYTYLLHAAFQLWFGGRAGVQAAYAAGPTDVFALARALAALLGAASVGLLAWAGARLFDRRAGLVAAAVLAVAFLPVHYAHFALNDVPTLAPLCLSLAGVAGIFSREGRLGDYALAGAGLGLACATKYTGGIVLLPLLGAALAGPGQPLGRRIGGLALAGVLALVAFLAANPFAALDFGSFRDGLSEQSSASSDGGGKLGLTASNGIVYYLSTLTWGLGWVPALAALGGAVVLAVRDWRRALVLVPAVFVFLVFMGTQDRYFARWLLPVYPLACLLAAYGALTALAFLRRPALAAGLAAALLCAQGLLFAVHNDVVLARADTRQLAREWMVKHVPKGTRVVIEPVMPDSWASDPGTALRGTTGNGARWAKWPTSRSRLNKDGTIRKGGLGPIVKLEDYERTLFPQLVRQYADRGYCTVLTGSTQFGRALAEPEDVPLAIRYYDELKRRGRILFAEPQPVKTFSFDFSFNSYPLSFDRPGPEIAIYRLRGGKCPRE